VTSRRKIPNVLRATFAKPTPALKPRGFNDVREADMDRRPWSSSGVPRDNVNSSALMGGTGGSCALIAGIVYRIPSYHEVCIVFVLIVNSSRHGGRREEWTIHGTGRDNLCRTTESEHLWVLEAGHVEALAHPYEKFLGGTDVTIIIIIFIGQVDVPTRPCRLSQIGMWCRYQALHVRDTVATGRYQAISLL
jgi:hypothetical protein